MLSLGDGITNSQANKKRVQREYAGKKSFLLGLSKAYEILSEFFRLTA